MNDEEMINFLCRVDGFLSSLEILDKHKKLVLNLENGVVGDLSEIKKDVQDFYEKLKDKKKKGI